MQLQIWALKIYVLWQRTAADCLQVGQKFAISIRFRSEWSTNRVFAFLYTQWWWLSQNLEIILNKTITYNSTFDHFYFSKINILIPSI